jgi:hypothetical protein
MIRQLVNNGYGNYEEWVSCNLIPNIFPIFGRWNWGKSRKVNIFRFHVYICIMDLQRIKQEHHSIHMQLDVSVFEYSKLNSWSITLLFAVKSDKIWRHIFTCVDDYRRGFGLEIGFIDHFNTRLVTTLNYSAITYLHTLQITTAQSKPSQSAFTRHFPVTDLNNGDFSASVLTSLLSSKYPTSNCTD